MTPNDFIAAAIARRQVQDLARSARPDAPILVPEDTGGRPGRRIRSALVRVLRRAADRLDDTADVATADASC